MKQRFFPNVMIIMLALVACVPSVADNVTQPSTSDEVATMVAETSTGLLPHSLYFVSPDEKGLSQVHRMEHDGKTTTQLSFEPVEVTEYDVSPADGSIAYVANNQLLLADAKGSNRRLLLDGGLVDEYNPLLTVIHSPVFSPDGGILAYAYKGLNFYDLSTDTSSLVIENQLTKPEIYNGVEQSLPIETYSPEQYSLDGKKLLINLGYFEGSSAAIYDPARQSLVRLKDKEGNPISYYGSIDWSGWSTDGSKIYAAVPLAQFYERSGEIWWADTATGTVTALFPFEIEEGATKVPFPYADEPYLAPAGQLYYFFATGTYSVESAFFELPVLQLVRSTLEDVSNRTVLRDEDFFLMREALWAPDASFVIVAAASAEDRSQAGGILELYLIDGQKGSIRLASHGEQMKWGP